MTAFLVVLVLSVLALTAYAAWRGAPWLPTPTRAVDAALTAAGVGPGDVVVDLGAGDGRVLRAAARRGAAAVGYELSPLLWGLAWVRTRGQASRVRVLLADGFRADLSSATVVFAFLRPQTMPLLAATLARRDDKPLRVLAYAFSLPGAVPQQTLRLPGCAPLYVYVNPAVRASAASPVRGAAFAVR